MYRIKLTDFEGPLDLLLFFIKRDELDIYDIPIAKITKDFLEYLQYLQELDLDIAGEFIVTAAELMQIKVQLLLPRPIWRRRGRTRPAGGTCPPFARLQTLQRDGRGTSIDERGTKQSCRTGKIFRTTRKLPKTRTRRIFCAM